MSLVPCTTCGGKRYVKYLFNCSACIKKSDQRDAAWEKRREKREQDKADLPLSFVIRSLGLKKSDAPDHLIAIKREQIRIKQELQFLDVVNFRRLGTTPSESVIKIYNKIIKKI